jgi:UPF0755 protein
MKKIFIFLIAGIVLTCWVYIAVGLLLPLPIGKRNIEIEIPKGATFRQVVDILSKEKVLRDKNLFLFIGRITGLDRKVRAGYYSIYSSMNLLDVFRIFKKGQIIEYEVTFREGDSLREIADKLSEKGIVSKERFWNLASDEKFLFLYDIDAPTFEGYLFPDTYRIPKGMTPEDAIGMMINRIREMFSDEMVVRASELGFSEREVLTLASIIEREAVIDAERPLISAVYHNRLKKKIPLQADPTAVYGVKSYSEKITLKDLKRKTPYNTYVIEGFPPGPIASPGLKSIVAALYPADVPYMFFVSNNDGTHQFSVTAEEHQAAVRAYREKKMIEAIENKEKSEDAEVSEENESS